MKDIIEIFGTLAAEIEKAKKMIIPAQIGLRTRKQCALTVSAPRCKAITERR